MENTGTILYTYYLFDNPVYKTYIIARITGVIVGLYVSNSASVVGIIFFANPIGASLASSMVLVRLSRLTLLWACLELSMISRPFKL